MRINKTGQEKMSELYSIKRISNIFMSSQTEKKYDMFELWEYCGNIVGIED